MAIHAINQSVIFSWFSTIDIFCHDQFLRPQLSSCHVNEWRSQDLRLNVCSRYSLYGVNLCCSTASVNFSHNLQYLGDALNCLLKFFSPFVLPAVMITFNSYDVRKQCCIEMSILHIDGSNVKTIKLSAKIGIYIISLLRTPATRDLLR